jgi:glucosamine--fructose-6-phosphate aminotransferase (isomerizing)
VQAGLGTVELGPYRHYMQKEIFEQPRAIADTLEPVGAIEPALFGEAAADVFPRVSSVLILACGTSYYAGCVARYWIESIAQIPVTVEIASEYRYRVSVADPNALVVVVSQSGETADTLAALKHAKGLGMHRTLAICNVPTSAMVRETAMQFLTRAGVEIGVASTKAFTSQVVALALLALHLGRLRGTLSAEGCRGLLQNLAKVPHLMEQALACEPAVEALARTVLKATDFLYLGRGINYPIALEGALKLKEISYVHAEGYPAGEMKHGPIALIDERMPVVALCPRGRVYDKMLSNVQEVKARGGRVIAVVEAGDEDARRVLDGTDAILEVPRSEETWSPLLMVIPLQLLAYHVALLGGRDVDQPRNLAKSVTVE